jgi:adhesin/invasin
MAGHPAIRTTVPASFLRSLTGPMSSKRLLRSIRPVQIVAAALLIASCSDSSGPKVIPPAAVAPSAGDGQAAVVNSAVALAPAVVVRDAQGGALPGVQVTFAVTAGGGSVTGATPTTNASGSAAVGSWTLGTAAGENTLTATVPGLPPVVFRATAGAGPAAALTPQAGEGQSASAGSAVAVRPAVLARDAFGNPVAGLVVTFTPAAGGGSVVGSSQTTAANGIAAVGEWRLGTAAGANTLVATAASLQPVTFGATATAGPPAAVTRTAGDGQTAQVGTAVAVQPVVRVADAHGNPVAGVAITFAVASGGGSVAGGAQTTGEDGSARPGAWTLGGAAGTQTLTASAAGLQPVTFTASATAGPPATLRIHAGEGQAAAAGALLPVAPAVLVEDAFGNAVANAAVSFEVASGGGAVTGASAATGANGVAAVGSWRLGPAAGPNTLVARVTGTSVPAVTFTATATSGPPATLTLQAGGGQTAVVGTAVAVQPTVLVRDASGNPVPGTAVVFAVTAGGGSVAGAAATTDAAGSASPANWTLGTTAGQNTLTATVAGLQPLVINALGVAGAAVGLDIAAGNGQTAAAGTAVPIRPAVRVRDQHGNAVSATAITFAVASGGGTVTGGSQVTGVDGLATVGSWTLGPNAGANSLSVTATGLAPVTITATATTAAAGGFTIDTRFIGGTAEQRAVVSQAAARWSEVIVGDLPAAMLTVPAGACQINHPAISEVIDDLLIFVEIRNIDGPGNILGRAGPCFVRGASALPILGIIELDAADMDLMQTAGTLFDVVLHEMGHVLGLGTLWNFPPMAFLSGAGGSNPFFTGAGAIAAYLGAGGTSSATVTPVPVENTGGASTRDGHWRESILGNELMTGFISGPNNPLSAITVRSFQDMGYVVNVAAADPYTMASPFTIGPPDRREPIGEEILQPRFVLEADGRIRRLR